MVTNRLFASDFPDCLPNRKPSPDVPPEKQRSFLDDFWQQLANHKWLESEKAGYDLGERAFQDWLAQHWLSYVRARWIEHLQGFYYWTELDCNDFGLLPERFQDHQELVQHIVERLKSGGENLTILQWACEKQIPTSPVIDILEVVNVNNRRWKPPYEGGNYKSICSSRPTTC